MIINEKTFNEMPKELQKLFDKLPNLSKEEVVAGFPDNVEGKDNFKHTATSIFGSITKNNSYNGNSKSSYGSASRFFYTAKAHSTERNRGLDDFEDGRPDTRSEIAMGTFAEKGVGNQKNDHPTVKPVKLMRYLVKLITPPNGTCLDAFMGSGTTGMACKLENFDFIGIEMDKNYFDKAKARIESVGEITEIKQKNGKLF